MTTMTTASPAKLRDGSWGARVRGTVTAGDTVTITTAAGKTWQARVSRVLWSGEGVSICATQSLDRPASHAHRSSCSCDADCCARRCQCEAHCNCRGGNVYDC